MRINELLATPSRPGPPEWFRGQAWREELGTLPTPSAGPLLRVAFAPGARTAWHMHPLGEVLHVLDGIARIGREGESVRHPEAGAETGWQEAVGDPDYARAE